MGSHALLPVIARFNRAIQHPKALMMDQWFANTGARFCTKAAAASL